MLATASALSFISSGKKESILSVSEMSVPNLCMTSMFQFRIESVDRDWLTYRIRMYQWSIKGSKVTLSAFPCLFWVWQLKALVIVNLQLKPGWKSKSTISDSVSHGSASNFTHVEIVYSSTLSRKSFSYCNPEFPSNQTNLLKLSWRTPSNAVTGPIYA